MSDRKALAREIAARTKPRLVEIEPGPRRELPTRRTIEVARQRRPLWGGGANSNTRRQDGRRVSSLFDPDLSSRTNPTYTRSQSE
jgi:hypothetical protein